MHDSHRVELVAKACEATRRNWTLQLPELGIYSQFSITQFLWHYRSVQGLALHDFISLLYNLWKAVT